jgi:hypothetical protein
VINKSSLLVVRVSSFRSIGRVLFAFVTFNVTESDRNFLSPRSLRARQISFVVRRGICNVNWQLDKEFDSCCFLFEVHTRCEMN